MAYPIILGQVTHDAGKTADRQAVRKDIPPQNETQNLF